MAYFCFFKQNTAYEVRISDWSSDVCSSDLCEGRGPDAVGQSQGGAGGDARASPARRGGDRDARDRERARRHRRTDRAGRAGGRRSARRRRGRDRTSVVQGKSVYVRVQIVGGRVIKKQTKNTHNEQHT